MFGSGEFGGIGLNLMTAVSAPHDQPRTSLDLMKAAVYALRD